MHGSKKEPRRSAPRINVRSNQIVYLSFQSGNGGIVLDVSTNGLGFQAVDPLKANEWVPFRLSVPGFPLIRLSGLVAWVDESRKRGGLQVVVPDKELPTFQLWQEYLRPQLQTMQLMASTRGPQVVSEEQNEAKPSRVSRNVLVATLLVVLCVALADGLQFLSTARRIRDLLWHPGRSRSSAMVQTPSQGRKTAAVTQNVPVAAASPTPQSRITRDERPSHYDALLFAPGVSSARADKLHPTVDPIHAEPVSAMPSARSQSALPVVAKVSAASVDRDDGDKARTPDLPHRSSSAWPADPEARNWPQAPALATSVVTPDTGRIIPPRHPIAAKQLDTTMDNSPQPATLPAVSQALAPAAQPAKALNATSGPGASLEPCQLVHSIQPAYPKEARKQKVQGDVKLRIVVGTDGTVRSVAPIDGGPPLLIAAAVNATRQFRYKPALLNGKPIETIQTVDISFKLEP